MVDEEDEDEVEATTLVKEAAEAEEGSEAAAVDVAAAEEVGAKEEGDQDIKTLRH